MNLEEFCWFMIYWVAIPSTILLIAQEVKQQGLIRRTVVQVFFLAACGGAAALALVIVAFFAWMPPLIDPLTTQDPAQQHTMNMYVYTICGLTVATLTFLVGHLVAQAMWFGPEGEAEETENVEDSKVHSLEEERQARRKAS